MFGVSKLFLKKIIFFVLQECITLIKSDSKNICIVTKVLFQVNAVLLNFSSKDPEKMDQFRQNIEQHKTFQHS